MGIREIFPLKFFNKHVEKVDGDFTPTVVRVASEDTGDIATVPESEPPKRGPAPD